MRKVLKCDSCKVIAEELPHYFKPQKLNKEDQRELKMFLKLLEKYTQHEELKEALNFILNFLSLHSKHEVEIANVPYSLEGYVVYPRWLINSLATSNEDFKGVRELEKAILEIKKAIKNDNNRQTRTRRN